MSKQQFKEATDFSNHLHTINALYTDTK